MFPFLTARGLKKPCSWSLEPLGFQALFFHPLEGVGSSPAGIFLFYFFRLERLRRYLPALLVQGIEQAVKRLVKFFNALFHELLGHLLEVDA